MTRGPVPWFAIWLCRTWVRAYTWRLDAASSTRRRMEIESDLHEHATEAAAAGVSGSRLGTEVLGRVLVGVPADLTWRRALQQQPQQRPAPGGVSMSEHSLPTNRALTVLGGLTIAWVWFCIIFFFGDVYLFPAGGDEITSGERLVWGVVPIASTVAMAIGLKLRSHSPRKALRLIVVGAIGPMVWFWTIFIYGPLMVATIAVAVNSTPRKPRPALA